MKDFILTMKNHLTNIFLNKETSKQIHEIKGEYGATTLTGQLKAEQALGQIKQSVSYKIGLAAGRVR